MVNISQYNLRPSQDAFLHSGGSEMAFQFETGKNAVERIIIVIVENKVISNHSFL